MQEMSPIIPMDSLKKQKVTSKSVNNNLLSTDQLVPDLISSMLASKIPLIQTMFKDDDPTMKKRPATAGTQFKVYFLFDKL